MEYKNYIWDFDGTLFNTYPKMLKALQGALAELGEAIDEKELYHAIKVTSIKTVHEKLGYSEAQFLPIYHRQELIDKTFVKPYTDTAETLAQVVKSGGRNFIFSHREASKIEKMLESFQVDQFISEIVSPEQGFGRKPSPEGLLYLIDKYHLAVDKTVFVGDRPLDIVAGKNAGLDTVLYDRDFFLENTKATYVVSSLSEVLELKKE